jgi:acetamidase/formamidase
LLPVFVEKKFALLPPPARKNNTISKKVEKIFMNNSNFHIIKATPETVKWGYFDNSARPVIKIKSGDIVYLETITHRAGDAPDFMMDDEVKNIYEKIEKNERGPGVHILTGPIYIKGARAGDVLECRILDLRPRLYFGINIAAKWGLLYDDFKKKEYVTLYKISEDTAYAESLFTYEYPTVDSRLGHIIPDDSVERSHSLKYIRIPLRYHLGTAGVAPAIKGKVDTVPPSFFGGNVDNRNFNVNTSMYYPVQVEGALFSAGDAHLAEGDGEISGTAIEGHMNATIQFVLRDDIKIQNPVLETPNHWMTHGFDTDANKAIRFAALEMIDFLHSNKSIGKNQAYSLLSVAGDFSFSQVVNRVKGVHCALRKDIFTSQEGKQDKV